MTARAEVTKRLTRDEAQDAGLIPHGHGWDEDLQRAVPIGTLVRADMLGRPLDLAESLPIIERNRKTLQRFIANQMQEAEYTKEKYPVGGKMHDFYILPNYDKKALTKQGSEKLAQLFRLRRKSTESVQRECTKEFAMAVVRVELVDQYGQPAGSGEAACSTAEKGFASERQVKKYGGDYRAAMNDIIARAGKRAFVQAVVYATATDEIFDASGEIEKEVEATGTTEEVRPPMRLPSGCGTLSGKTLAECGIEPLSKLHQWLKDKGKPSYQSLIDAIGDELDQRRSPGGEEFPG